MSARADDTGLPAGGTMPKRRLGRTGVAYDHRPLAPEQMDALLARTARAGAHGRFERYKTTGMFDSTNRHPEWLTRGAM
jgi:hypothetical protein